MYYNNGILREGHVHSKRHNKKLIGGAIISNLQQRAVSHMDAKQSAGSTKYIG
jgi:hypothetical protein